MQEYRKIDCHTHIINSTIRDTYFAHTDGYAIVMEMLPAWEGPGLENAAWQLAAEDDRLFLCPAIDLSKEIPSQLQEIERRMPAAKVVGLKIYLTYQTGRADDPRLMPVYDFAARHGLTVTYHTGSCSLVLPTDHDMEGSNAKYVEQVARRFPGVNFVLAHMDDPRFEACIRIVHRYPNLFTDFSGAYEPGTKEGADMDWAIETFGAAIHQFPDMHKKILYGTDFCPPISLTAIEEYDITIHRIFPEKAWPDIYCHNCLRAFPKLATYLAAARP